MVQVVTAHPARASNLPLARPGGSAAGGGPLSASWPRPLVQVAGPSPGCRGRLRSGPAWPRRPRRRHGAPPPARGAHNAGWARKRERSFRLISFRGPTTVLFGPGGGDFSEGTYQTTRDLPYGQPPRCGNREAIWHWQGGGRAGPPWAGELLRRLRPRRGYTTAVPCTLTPPLGSFP